jgi:fatty-acyl-CoA synthase
VAETLTALLAELIRDRPDATALVDGDDRPGFAELDERARRVAGALADEGVAAGDRVAIWLPNCAAWLELELALARLGAIAVAVNTKLRAHEVADILERSDASLLALWPGFKDIDFAGILERVERERLAGLRLVVAVGGAEADVHGRRVLRYEALRDHAPLHADRASPDAPCNVFTSSGTTGLPKLVVHHQAGIVAHACAVAGAFGYREPGSVVLAMLPLCGVFGFNTALGALAAGAPSVLLAAYDARRAVELIERERVTATNGSHEMLARILDAAGDGGAIASLREAGFAAFSGDARALVDAGDALGKAFYQAYGSSEVQALMAHAPAEAPPEERAVAGGRPVSEAIDVRVRSREDGSLLPRGEDGELEVRGPNVMAGYLGDRDAEADAFTDDGYLRTGDLGRLTAPGRFAYVARHGDVLRLGGFLVSPREIEAFLEGLDGIEAAQVVGVEVDGEPRPVAFVVGGGVDEHAVIAACRSELARFKVPCRVLAVDAFPTAASANGERVQRGELRRRAAQAVGGA